MFLCIKTSITVQEKGEKILYDNTVFFHQNDFVFAQCFTYVCWNIDDNDLANRGWWHASENTNHGIIP